MNKLILNALKAHQDVKIGDFRIARFSDTKDGFQVRQDGTGLTFQDKLTMAGMGRAAAWIEGEMRRSLDAKALETSFGRCVPEFRAKIEAIAERAGMDCLKVYSMWRKYSETCRNCDQSPVFSEFQQWNRATLNPNNELEIQ